MAGDYLLGDMWASAWRFFVAKRVTDAAFVAGIWALTANEYEKLSDSFWILMAVALVASAGIWFRDVVAYFVLTIAAGDEKRYGRSALEGLRQSSIDPSKISPARMDGLKNLIDSEMVPAKQRVEAAIIFSAFEGAARMIPWYRRAYARDLVDNAILRYTLENRRERGAAADDDLAEHYYD